MTATIEAERRQLLADLCRQLDRLDRARERTAKAIRQLEWEVAPGRGREREAIR
jgi:hypothetical protein